MRCVVPSAYCAAIKAGDALVESVPIESPIRPRTVFAADQLPLVARSMM